MNEDNQFDPSNELNSQVPEQLDTQAPEPNSKHDWPFVLNVTYRVIRSLMLLLIVVVLAVATLGVGTGIGYFASLVKTVDVPKPDDLIKKISNLDQQSNMTYADGSQIAVIQSDLIRTNVSSDSISDFIKEALISTEDENFFKHKGIVPKAIARATISDVIGIGNKSGGSTITQQLVKQQVLTNETSYRRKASEIVLALKTEKIMSKDEILSSYLNVSPFGRNNHGENIAGIEEAALGIFGVHASDVTLPQAAFLAGLPQSPIEYSPYTNDAQLKEDLSAGLNRKNDVLFNMYREKIITKDEYEAAKGYDLKQDFLKPEPKAENDNGFLYNYIYDEATRVLMPSYYEADGYTEADINESKQLFDQYFERVKKDIARSGYTIHSTIDKTTHNAMQEAVNNFGYLLDDGSGKLLETGSVLMDNQTGRIYGFIGGRDYNQNQNNHAFQTRRSPGSTMKPILAYAPAIDNGIIGSESKLSDYPLKYKNGQEVKNYSDKGSNSFKSVREALKWSLNIPVVNLYNDMLQSIDPKQYFDKMNIGLNPDEYYRESIPLGGTDHGMTVLEETEAYATLANKGVYNKGYSIDKITNEKGDVIYEHKQEPNQVFKPATASIMNDMMRDVLKSGTGQPAQDALKSVNPTLAKADWVGKTGTSENEQDYWFTASTPGVTMSSWIGYDDNTQMNSTWNKQNMVYWAYMTNYVYQRNPDVFKASDKFTLDPSVKKEKVVEFTGEKVGVVKVDNQQINLKGSKEIDSLYATDGPKDSVFKFGIGGTDANYKDAWKTFSKPATNKRK
ncbi:transglycosylase domain-containing protein [Vagococcus martis]|uniref:transglycosylase domain-containing protein n=1 Tax=Vagococcus martis TaxID=1768210 RepID=UPI002697CAEF